MCCDVSAYQLKRSPAPLIHSSHEQVQFTTCQRSDLVPQIYCLPPEAICNGHFLLNNPVLLKLQLLEAVVVHLITVTAFLSLVFLYFDEDTLRA